MWNYAGRYSSVALAAAHASHIDAQCVRRRAKLRDGGKTCIAKLRPDEMGRVDLIHMDQELLP